MRGVEAILFLVMLGTVVAAFAGRLRVPAPSCVVFSLVGLQLPTLIGDLSPAGAWPAEEAQRRAEREAEQLRQAHEGT